MKDLVNCGPCFAGHVARPHGELVVEFSNGIQFGRQVPHLGPETLDDAIPLLIRRQWGSHGLRLGGGGMLLGLLRLDNTGFEFLELG